MCRSVGIGLVSVTCELAIDHDALTDWCYLNLERKTKHLRVLLDVANSPFIHLL